MDKDPRGAVRVAEEVEVTWSFEVFANVLKEGYLYFFCFEGVCEVRAVR